MFLFANQANFSAMLSAAKHPSKSWLSVTRKAGFFATPRAKLLAAQNGRGVNGCMVNSSIRVKFMFYAIVIRANPGV
jgi:hypothetical protein